MADYTIKNGELFHYGIRGQRWKIRRYQNEDGSLTPAGRERYGIKSAKERRADYIRQLSYDSSDKEIKKLVSARDFSKDYKINKHTKNVAKDLNQLDKDRVSNLYREEKAKASGNLSKYKRYHDARVKTEKYMNNLLKNAKKAGMKLDSEEIQRNARVGQEQIAFLIAGVPGWAFYNLGTQLATGENGFRRGTKYSRAR